MDHRYLTTLSSVLALVILAPVSLAGQDAAWVTPRTAWGDPDLMGTYHQQDDHAAAASGGASRP